MLRLKRVCLHLAPTDLRYLTSIFGRGRRAEAVRQLVSRFVMLHKFHKTEGRYGEKVDLNDLTLGMKRKRK